MQGSTTLGQQEPSLEILDVGDQHPNGRRVQWNEQMTGSTGVTEATCRALAFALVDSVASGDIGVFFDLVSPTLCVQKRVSVAIERRRED